jgi:hypothetical protein
LILQNQHLILQNQHLILLHNDQFFYSKIKNNKNDLYLRKYFINILYYYIIKYYNIIIK